MPPALNPPLAIAFMIVATLFIAATMLLAKALGTDALGEALHPLQVSHGRFLFAFAVVSVVVLIRRPSLRTEQARLHIARSTFGFFGVSMMFAAAA
ncbi:MAG: EamA/RhaT family transporter, partial [Pseudomonadota bacterium]